MGATSVTGTGDGSVKIFTTKELADSDALLSSYPKVIFSGRVESTSVPTSPPTENGNSVVFPHVLVGDSTHYSIMLTTISGGYAYVVDTDEVEDDEDVLGSFSGFSFLTETDCTLMYIVVQN